MAQFHYVIGYDTESRKWFIEHGEKVDRMGKCDDMVRDLLTLLREQKESQDRMRALLALRAKIRMG